VHRTGGRCQRFEGIHLVEESTTTRKTLEMLGFVWPCHAEMVLGHPVSSVIRIRPAGGDRQFQSTGHLLAQAAY
jgi:hypothetical protein